MASKTKTGPAPATTTAVCPDCPAAPLEATTTVYGCEHGTWTFDPSTTPEVNASEDELRAALLSSLDEATLRDLLAAKTAPPAPPSKPDAPVSKTDGPPVKPTDPKTIK